MMAETVSIKSAVRSFGRKLEAEGRSPKTVTAYLRDLRCMAGALNHLYPEAMLNDVTSTMIDEALTSSEVLESARGGSRSRASMHRFRAAIRSFFAWAEQSGLVERNPAAYLALHRLPRRPPRFLTEVEKHRLIKIISSESNSIAYRDRVIIELFLGTGIRLQELVNLDIEDVELEARHLRIRAKGGVPQVKFLKSNLRSLLRSYLTQHRKRHVTRCRALFLSNRGERLCTRQVPRRLQYWLETAGIDKSLSPHALRHTFATHLYSRTGDILVVQRALGHRDLSTTLIYTHLVDSQLENALERL